MPVHRFGIGQLVRLRTNFGQSFAYSYRVTRFLPTRDSLPQYRIRSDADRHERVTTEDDLEELPDDIDRTLGRRATTATPT